MNCVPSVYCGSGGSPTSLPIAAGLSLVAPEVRAFAPQPDGRAVTLWASNERTEAELATWSGVDALAWAGFDRGVRAHAGFLAALGEQTPPPTSGAGLGDAITGLLLGRAYKKLSKDDARNLLRVLPMAVADFVGDAFETDAIRATVAARALLFTGLGAWSMGTTATLFADSAGNDGGAAGQAVFAKGGPGAVTAALASDAAINLALEDDRRTIAGSFALLSSLLFSVFFFGTVIF